MNKVNHISWTLGLSLWIFYLYFDFSLVHSMIYSFFCASIAWLPDVDLKIIKKINEFNRSTLFLFYPLTFIFKILFKHRSITHSIWIPLCLFFISEYVLISGISRVILLIISLAIFLHIFEDTLTVRGVEIFYPFSLRIRFLRFHTDSKIHFYILEFCAYFILIAFIFANKI
jgi:membrane-bound metal-dependent hydrolase YbcI (DUF457 family)